MKKIYYSAILTAVLSGCSLLPREQTLETREEFKVADVKFYGTLWNEEYNKYHIISQDGGSSFAVPGGAIWCFGDTFKGIRAKDGKPEYKGGAVSCAIAFLPDNSRFYPPEFQYLADSSGIVESPFEYTGSETPEKNSIWPLAGIYINGKSYLFYSLIEKTGTGSWDFKVVGSGLAVSEKPLGHYKRILRNEKWEFPVSPSAIVELDDFLYLYSIENTDADTQGVFLARVKPDKLEEAEHYEYFSDKGTFSKNIEDKVVLVDRIYGQTSVAWNSYLERYLMLTSSNFWEPVTLKFYASETPAGPWYDTGVRLNIPERRQGKKVELVYCAYLHPELFSENGKVIYLTYSLMLRDSIFDANCEMAALTLEKK